MSMERLRQGSQSLIIKRTAVEKAIGKGQHRKEGGVFTTLHIPGDSRRQTGEFRETFLPRFRLKRQSCCVKFTQWMNYVGEFKHEARCKM